MLFVAELCNAATKIQASFRGHMSRKQIGKEEDSNAGESQKEESNVSEYAYFVIRRIWPRKIK